MATKHPNAPETQTSSQSALLISQPAPRRTIKMAKELGGDEDPKAFEKTVKRGAAVKEGKRGKAMLARLAQVIYWAA